MLVLAMAVLEEGVFENPVMLTLGTAVLETGWLETATA